MPLKWMRERAENLGFKEAYKATRKKIKSVQKIEDKNARLAELENVQKTLDQVFDEGDYDVTHAVDKPDSERDGIAAVLQPKNVMFGLCMCFIPTVTGTSVPFLASLAPLLISGVGFGVAVALIATGHVLLRRHRAKELGLSVADVKYARKLKMQQTKVNRFIKKIVVQDGTKTHLDNLCMQFAAAASPKYPEQKQTSPVLNAATRAASAMKPC